MRGGEIWKKQRYFAIRSRWIFC